MKHVIAFAGFATSGKDTCADYLVRHGFRRGSFAEPMKRSLKLMCPQIPDEHLWGPSALRASPIDGVFFSGECMKCGFACHRIVSGEWMCGRCLAVWPHQITVRVALEVMGTEFGRRMCESLWVDAEMRRINADPHDRWALTDTRFRNEMEGVRRHGGIVVRLLRGKRTRDHRSETELEAIPLEFFDHVIDNRTTTLDQLYDMLDALVA